MSIYDAVIAIVALVLGYTLRALLGRRTASSAERMAKERLLAADRDALERAKAADIEARAAVVNAKEQFENSTRARRKELEELATRLNERDENIDRRLKVVEAKEDALSAKAAELTEREVALGKCAIELDKRDADADVRLQRLAGLTKEQAAAELRKDVQESVRAETGALLRRLQEEARANADRDAKDIIANAIQRYAAQQTPLLTTSAFSLPQPELKARLIGKEGRNIKALEAATGVTFVFDGAPESVIISCFDPVRREVARVALKEIIADGRFQPQRIEEIVSAAKENVDKLIRAAGRSAADEAKIQSLGEEAIYRLGSLKYRTSYSQNALEHSLEVSALMGAMADEMGLDTALARRIGLLHDIGKSTSQEVEGGHAKIGAELLRREHENPVVINAVAAHHRDEDPASIYAVLCAAADTISSARPGARTEPAEIFFRRLRKLEEIASSQKGVRGAFALQAGRELRIVVNPDELNDNDAMILAQTVAAEIQRTLTYAGQIRVVVVREKRCMEYAR